MKTPVPRQLQTIALACHRYARLGALARAMPPAAAAMPIVDVSENAPYRYFVVLSWLPIYAVIYLAPRVHP